MVKNFIWNVVVAAALVGFIFILAFQLCGWEGKLTGVCRIAQDVVIFWPITILVIALLLQWLQNIAVARKIKQKKLSEKIN